MAPLSLATDKKFCNIGAPERCHHRRRRKVWRRHRELRRARRYRRHTADATSCGNSDRAMPTNHSIRFRLFRWRRIRCDNFHCKQLLFWSLSYKTVISRPKANCRHFLVHFLYFQTRNIMIKYAHSGTGIRTHDFSITSLVLSFISI